MLVKRGPEAGREEYVPCHYCSSLARLGHDEHGYVAFMDNPNHEAVSRGQVWSIRESMMLPIAEYLKTADRDLVYGEARSGKSRATTIGTWIKLHGSKETPRPCIIADTFVKNKKTYLMGSFNDGQFKELSLCVDMFCVQVDPSPCDNVLNSSEQHIHATPRWCSAKKQFVCVLPINFRGRLPEGPVDDTQGYVIDRWVEQHGLPEENGHHYGFSDKQLNRLNLLSQARVSQWRNTVSKTHKQDAIKQFRRFVTKHLGAEGSPAGQDASLKSRILPSLRTKRTGFGGLLGHVGGGLSVLSEDGPSDITSHRAHPMASPTRRSFADGRRSSRASVRH